MGNIYIGQFKDLLKSNLNNAQKINSQIEDAYSKYSDEYVHEAVKPLENKKKTAYAEAVDKVNMIYEQIRTHLAASSFPNVEQLTADRLLFDSSVGISLSASELEALAERYEKNYTMSRLIKDWICENYSGMNEYTAVANGIHLPSEQLEVYRQFAESAIDTLNQIYFGDASTLDTIVNSYADESFGAELFEIIGNGTCISEYNSSRIPYTAKHCFDDIVLRNYAL